MSEHSHHHGHAHAHAHAPDTFNRAFLIAVVANGLFVVAQILFSWIANSTSLLADAVHNLGDVLGLALAWIANGLQKRRPTSATTYGMKKSSILAALANGTLLIFSCGIIATEAVYQLFAPEEVKAVSVMVVAGIGIVVNGATALLFMRGSHDLNIRSAFLHLVYDALISAGVVVAAGILYVTGWLWIDPVVGLLIAAIVLKGTWSLFSDSFRLIIDGVPRQISLFAVREMLLAEPGVKDVHDLHIWAMSTLENALSVHLWMPDAPLSDEARKRLTTRLRETHRIHHTTIQVERTQLHCDDACHHGNEEHGGRSIPDA